MDDDFDEDGASKVYRFNEYEIRDAFLEFMTSIMSGYTKCLVSSLSLISFARTHLTPAKMSFLMLETSSTSKSSECRKSPLRAQL